jgi:hypothetical protein
MDQLKFRNISRPSDLFPAGVMKLAAYHFSEWLRHGSRMAFVYNNNIMNSIKNLCWPGLSLLNTKSGRPCMEFIGYDEFKVTADIGNAHHLNFTFRHDGTIS